MILKKLLREIYELNIQKKKMMGSGDEHDIYPFKLKPGYVIKTIKDIEWMNWDELLDDRNEVYQTMIKNPEIFAKIDKVNWDKYYLVQEKLDEKKLTKDLKNLKTYLKNNQPDQWNVELEDKDRPGTIKNIGKRYPGIITRYYVWPELLKEIDNTPYKFLKPKLEDLFNRLNKAGLGINNRYLGDLKPTNLGYDLNGKIKIFDFSFGELSW